MSEIITHIPHIYTEGDTLPEILMTFDEENLTGFTVELEIRRPDESLLVVPATFIDQPAGKFKFSFAAGELQAGLGQISAVVFKIGAEVQHTEPLFLDVREKP